MFGDTMTVCVYEKTPNIIGLITKKNSKPDARSKIWLLTGLLDEEANAASISSPKRTTADTSIKPVKIETNRIKIVWENSLLEPSRKNSEYLKEEVLQLFVCD